MYVDNINLLSAHFDAVSASHRAMVHLVIGLQNVTLACNASLPEKAPVPAVIAGLIEDAKRQIMRMPEYRNGAQVLHFTPKTKAQIIHNAA